MSNSSASGRAKVIAALVAILAICLVVPYEHWDADIVSGRLVSEGTIVERDDDAIVVRLFSMGSTDAMAETDTFLLLEGNVSDDAHVGQRVRIGYSSAEGLYANPDQTVQVAYRVDGNLLTGLILRKLVPVQDAGTDLTVAGIQSDGTRLAYNRAK